MLESSLTSVCETGLKLIDEGPWKMLGALWREVWGLQKVCRSQAARGLSERDARILSICSLC